MEEDDHQHHVTSCDIFLKYHHYKKNVHLPVLRIRCQVITTRGQRLLACDDDDDDDDCDDDDDDYMM